MIARTLLSSLLIWAVAPAIAQIEFAYSQFELINQPNGVQVRWTMNAGNTCNGTQIERSTDSTHFTKVGGISGICGDSVEAVSYDYVDADAPPNRKLYYRLYFGGLGYSEVQTTIYVKPDEGGYFVAKETVTGPRTVYFHNPNSNNVSIRVFNPLGRQVYQAETRGNSVQVPVITGSMHDAVLFIQLLRDGEVFAAGKI